MPDEYLFISDCHLQVERPDVTGNLISFLETRARKARCLYILGDLFEVWLGDDDPADAFAAVFDCLRQLSLNTKISFLAGNRDFLLGEKLANKIGVEIINEPVVLTLDGLRVLLLHGDTLCTDDKDYQAFRSMVRTTKWKAQFLAKPLPQRQKIAAGLRSDSGAAMSGKTMEIMDVNDDAVESCFESHDSNILIHGHTHRPGTHFYSGDRTRYVLGDWNPSASFLSWDRDNKFQLQDPRVFSN